MAGSRQSHADVSDGSESFAVSKLCRRYRALAKALSCRSCTDGSEGFAVSKPYRHIGRELRLSRAKALHKRADRPGGRGKDGRYLSAAQIVKR